MRRILSILLAIGLGLGPALAAFPANALVSGLASGLASGWTGKVDESSLPACCRRNGKHHCAMPTAGQAAGETAVSAQDCCPCWPHALVSTAPVSAALLAVAAGPLAHPIERRALHSSAEPARITDRRSCPQRGPPSPQSI